MTKPSAVVPPNWREVLGPEDRLALVEEGFLRIRAAADESAADAMQDLLRRDARHPQARSIRARAGDVLVFSAHLWHAGSENRSGARTTTNDAE
jgi:ectoine hydroxylase-related dioxygenase (phytanoyl-CoA dioxygenase family)